MTNLCNLNGQVMPEAEARVSVLDRGFLFGDSIYEVIRTHRGVPFAWPEHLERLHASADALDLPLDVEDRELTSRLTGTVQASGNEESYVRIVMTRGPGSAPNIDIQYATGPTTCLIMVRERPPSPQPAGAHLAIVPRLRTDRRALDPAIKSGNYLNNVMGLKEAKDRGATDCLFLNSEGKITESSTSNLWLVKDDTVRTPPLSAGLLAGVTRRLLLEMCQEERIPCVETDMGEADVRSADEIFLTSTLRNVHPVTHIDGNPLQGGRIGAMTQRLQGLFEQFCDRRTREVYEPWLRDMLGQA